MTLFLFIPIVTSSIFLIFNLFSISIAILLVFISLSYTWSFNIVDIGRTLSSIFYGKKIINKNLIITQKKINLNTKKIILKNLKIKNLSYSFENKQIFSNFNFQIFENQKIAIVGKNGCGKSTLLKLMLNYYDNYKGEIIWNDKNLANLSNEDLVASINYLNSDNKLLNGTIIENITLWDEKYKIEKIKEILSIVGLNNVSPNYKIDYSNTTLSEGQIQRILIGRLLYNKKPILIIDEGYSNIDKITTQKIRQYFLLQKDLIYIEVSHHFDHNEIEQFDKILQL